MADISTLGEMRPVETLDLSDVNYKDASAGFNIPAAGVYTVQAPPSFPKEAFGRTKAGALSAQIDPRIVGPTNEGFQLRFIKISAKTFKRGGATVSQFGDYLRANGFQGRLATEQDQADAVEQTANSLYQVAIDWRAYNKDTGYALEGMENFPSDGKGGHLPWCEDPAQKNDDGTPKRLRAQVVVTRFLPAGA